MDHVQASPIVIQCSPEENTLVVTFTDFTSCIGIGQHGYGTFDRVIVAYKDWPRLREVIDKLHAEHSNRETHTPHIGRKRVLDV
jgi:hypothetical protein